MNGARVGREGLTWRRLDCSSPKPLGKRRSLLLSVLVLWAPLLLFLGHPLFMAAAADVQSLGGDPLPLKITVTDDNDIRFRKLSGSVGISQTRVASVVQDGLGFLWFGTQYGLNRYDGYRSKAFKHEPGRPDSLGCVYIRSLFVDHSGTLWIGCDQSLDKYNPINETFTHYHVVRESPGSLPAPVAQFSEDRAGMLWLATARGLYRFDPVSGRSTRYAHDPGDPATIAGNDVKSTGEDRSGQFWVADNGGLEAFDRETGKVTRHIPFNSEIGEFHQDRSGIFWITSTSLSCPLATLDLKSERITCHAINYMSHGHLLPVKIYTMLESQDGTMWLASMQAGILKIDRNLREVISYGNHSEDSESLGSNDAIALYQDKEGDIWVCLQETDPNYFTERLQAFESFTYQRGSLVNPLVTSIYEDREGILWIGSMGGLNRIDRRSGKNTTPPGSGPGNEMMAITQDRSGSLLAGTFQGLHRLDEKTGRLSPYLSHDSRTPPKKTSILRMLFDPNETLWVATYGGVGRLDPATGYFSIYTPDKQNTIDYVEIKQDGKENLWLGTAQSGLHRFNPRTAEFTIYAHNTDDPRSLSDDRVNSVYFDHSGVMWVGTQNGLDRFDGSTRSFKTYYEQDGLAGNVVSCILEDDLGNLWMGTNSGLSSFNPREQTFRNFSAADGLPGSDLSGWGTCYKSPSGEMFFGGFSGATAFYPSKMADTSFIPTTVLTDFRISGRPVPIGPHSPLSRSITYTNRITLSHSQNIFSIEFSALSYFNAETNRYRYRLDGLEHQWNEVGSDQRVASYTTLPAGTYVFHVQGAVSRGRWSEPGASLEIEVLPAWWNSWWFRVFYGTLLLLTAFAVYIQRVGQRKRAAEEDERLRQAQADLVRASRISTMGELIASLAHEIKQPIAAARTDVQTCMRWLARDVPDLGEAREAASRAIKDVVWASEIISRIGRHFKKGTLQREPIAVNDVIREMVVLLDTEMTRHTIAVQTTLAEDLPRVIADQVELQQVLMNLMLNGMESMKELENPGTLRIVTQPAEEGFVMISVTDTGKGIQPEQAEHIFDAFFTTKKEGTGMGLAISRSIIESHGGRLWFTPNSGPGATFYFTLPVDASVSQAERSSPFKR
jgi:signal transduction histidine kinase/ligand-binding sensor domain-containing protein